MMSLIFKKEGYFQLFKGKPTLNHTEDKIYIIDYCLLNLHKISSKNSEDTSSERNFNARRM